MNIKTLAFLVPFAVGCSSNTGSVAQTAPHSVENEHRHSNTATAQENDAGHEVAGREVAGHDPAEHTDPLAAVRAVHGGAGPWAVAGFRIGQHALALLQLERGSFDLEVTHHSPQQVQFTCIADGVAAATGASLGKLNLKLEEASPTETRTVFRNRTTGQSLVVELTEEFRSQYADVPRAHLPEAGREVLSLPGEQIFRVVP